MLSYSKLVSLKGRYGMLCGFLRRMQGTQRRAKSSSSAIRSDLLLVDRERNLFQQVFPDHEENRALLNGKTNQTAYLGFDPTADSLHIGHLLPLIALLHFQRGGHDIIALIGGATGLVGDPSGRVDGRPSIDQQRVGANAAAIEKQIQGIVDNHCLMHTADERLLKAPLGQFRLLNNLGWYGEMRLLDFLSSIAHHFRVTNMIRRESVRLRLASSHNQDSKDTASGDTTGRPRVFEYGSGGLSLTEFTYQVLQAHDWFTLHDRFGCRIQTGGSDQLGNMVAGYEYVKRQSPESTLAACTVPLLTGSSGQKVGKSDADASQTIWLDKNKTSPFRFYQHFLRTPDSHVEEYLQRATFLFQSEIRQILKSHSTSPHKRLAARRLAEQLTLLVHGENGLDLARRSSRALYEGSQQDLALLTREEFRAMTEGVAEIEFIRRLDTRVLDLLERLGHFNSREAARRAMQSNGVQVNHSRISNSETVVTMGTHVLPRTNSALIRCGSFRSSVAAAAAPLSVRSRTSHFPQLE